MSFLSQKSVKNAFFHYNFNSNRRQYKFSQAKSLYTAFIWYQCILQKNLDRFGVVIRFYMAF